MLDRGENQPKYNKKQVATFYYYSKYISWFDSNQFFGYTIYRITDPHCHQTGTCSAPPYNPVTAIEAVETEKAEDGAWYTIQGVRVDKPAKGLYIHNGRKVVVK